MTEALTLSLRSVKVTTTIQETWSKNNQIRLWNNKLL